MDLWWLYVGALLLATGAIFSWLSNDWANSTPTDEKARKLKNQSVKRFDRVAAWTNGIGALVVAGGTAISAVSTNVTLGIIALIVLAAVGIFLTLFARAEGKKLDEINRKAHEIEQNS